MKNDNFEDRIRYPRPDFRRSRWVDLNGTWDFQFDDLGCGERERWYVSHNYERTIMVPFCYQSIKSGIGETAYHPCIWYHRSAELSFDAEKQRLLLHFGAVDYHAKVWINGMLACEHSGGHASFRTDITAYAVNGKNEITVMVEDTQSCGQPRGKQIWNDTPERCWYTATSGIWQPVWIDIVGSSYFDGLHIVSDIDNRTAEISVTWAGNADVAAECAVFLKGKALGFSCKTTTGNAARFLLEIPEIDPIEEYHHWTPETPVLFDVQLTLRAKGTLLDKVDTYFGMRKISIENGQILLNNRPFYQKLILNQGYWVESLLTAPDDECFESDIQMIKQMGFNGVRMHQKIEDPRFLYWADKLGLLVWEEMPSAYVFSEKAMGNTVREWEEILQRDYNHPCIVTWVPMNESWGVRNIYMSKQQQNYAQMLYYFTKAMDPTRLVSTNDGWEQVQSDLCSVHDYRVSEDNFAEKYADVDVLLGSSAQGRMLYAKDHSWEGEPIILSEFGGRAIGKQTGGWGYSSNADSTEEFLQHYQKLISAILRHPVLQGFCYTQFTDVMQEKNGLLDENHVPKVDPAKIAAANGG